MSSRRPGRTLVPSAIRRALGRSVPDYMVPASVVVLDAMPLNPNGKLDRARLPAPDWTADGTTDYVAPRTATERALAAVWADVLRVERVGVDDNFFSLGGDSILSIQVVAQARQAGLAVTSRDVYRHQTVAALAQCVAAAGQPAPGPGPEAEATGPAPLTPIQHWLFESDAERAGHFGQTMSVELADGLDATALEAALNDVVAHHDALRSRFVPDGDGRWRQHIDGEAPGLRCCAATPVPRTTPRTMAPSTCAAAPCCGRCSTTGVTGGPPSCTWPSTTWWSTASRGACCWRTWTGPTAHGAGERAPRCRRSPPRCATGQAG